MASGYLIVTRYKVLYQKALGSHRYDNNPIDKPIYGVPVANRRQPPKDKPKYRGIDRDPVYGMSFASAEMITTPGHPVEANLATQRLEEIQSPSITTH